MMTAVDDVASACRRAAVAEAQECMRLINPHDHMTACEAVALLTLMRPIRDRVQQKPAAVLRLAGRRNPMN